MVLNLAVNSTPHLHRSACCHSSTRMLTIKTKYDKGRRQSILIFWYNNKVFLTSLMHNHNIRNNICLHSERKCFPLSHTIIDIIKHKLYVFVIPSVCDQDDMFKNPRQEAERQFKGRI